MCSPQTWLGRRKLLLPDRHERPYLVSDTSWGWGSRGTRQEKKSRLFTHPLLPWWDVATVRLFVFLSCVTGVEQLHSKNFLSCQADPFLVLWPKRRGFCWAFLFACLLFWSAPVNISRLLGSSAQNLVSKTQRNIQEMQPHVIPWVPRSLVHVLSSRLFRVFLCIFHTQCPKFLLVLSRRSRESGSPHHDFLCPLLFYLFCFYHFFCCCSTEGLLFRFVQIVLYNLLSWHYDTLDK